MLTRLIASIALLTTLASAAIADDTPATTLLVLNKADTSLAIVDPTTLKVVGRVFAGQDPHEVVASADGKTAFVSNYGGFGAGLHTLSVIDLIAQKPLPAVELGAMRSPHGLALSEGKIYFTAESNKVIGRYDPATEKIDWVLGLGQDRTHMIVVAKDGKRIVTSNVNSDTISILELTTPSSPQPPMPPPPDGGPGGPPPGGGPGGPPPRPNGPSWVETHIKVGKGPEGFDVSPDGKKIWAANSHAGSISVIDVEKKEVTATFDIGARMANRLKFTPDGKQVLVSDLGGGGVIVIEVATDQVIKKISLGHGAAGILMQPDGARAFVGMGDGVGVIDLKTLEVTGHIDTGRGADGLGWAVRN